MITTTTRDGIWHNLKHYISNALLLWAVIALYKYSSYYSNFLRQETQQAFLYLGLAYTIGGLAVHLALPARKIGRNKGTVVLGLVKKIVGFSLIKLFRGSCSLKLESYEKTTVLFLAVKIFFTPLMINFAFDNYFVILNQATTIIHQGGIFSIAGFNNIIFPIILTGVFLLDTLYFSFGYIFDAGFLKNTIRSVDPTIFGWAVALVCYPPFNSFYGKYVTWYANDYVQFGSETATFLMRIIISLFLLGYLSATLALGTKCSNLTNRGIVTTGPYALIRHPAYICKNIAWWITILPVMGVGAFLSMLSWSVIYFFRAVTEERHLRKDPDYQEYCRKVKHRFIPGII